jgi:hypothetical protein
MAPAIHTLMLTHRKTMHHTRILAALIPMAQSPLCPCQVTHICSLPHLSAGESPVIRQRIGNSISSKDVIGIPYKKMMPTSTDLRLFIVPATLLQKRRAKARALYWAPIFTASASEKPTAR